VLSAPPFEGVFAGIGLGAVEAFFGEGEFVGGVGGET
jgi:hypothetical protein